MPKLSVIIPSYNHGSYLKERVDSVLHQQFPDFELIIVDDNSTDNSSEIIESYRHHPLVSHIVYAKENSGSPFFHWQTGIELAKSDWIWIAESDDVAHPYFLEKVADVISNNPSVGLVYCDTEIIDDAGRPIMEAYSKKKNKLFNTKKWSVSHLAKGSRELDEYLKYDCTINNVSGMVFRKDLALPILKELSEYRYFGDWFFVLKLASQTDIFYYAEVLNFYRKHTGSALHVSTDRPGEVKEYFMILKLLYYNKYITDKKKILDHFALHYLGFGFVKEGIKPSMRIFKKYLELDKKIALATIRRWLVLRTPGKSSVRSGFENKRNEPVNIK
jgi:glycosyltransferase involved in cell wall biosynthesis